MAAHRKSKKGKLNRIGRRRRNMRIALAVIAISLLGLFGYQLQRAGMVPANQVAEEWYEADRAPRELVWLPADDAPHENQTEWWYYNGHLQTQDGQHFSFHYVIFVINRLAGHTVAHASFIDHQTGRHYSAQQRTAGKPAREVRDGFDFRFGDWHMAGSDGIDRLAIATPDFEFDLALEATAAPVLHGTTGLLDFKQAGTSYYYSRPRLQITGTAGPAGASQLVSGEAWFDHQWGDFRVTALAWNWFALQLDDGRDLMLFELFDTQGETVLHFGTLSGQGHASTLTEADFAIEVTEHWLSDTTRIRYPIGWRVRVPGQAIDIALEPVVHNAEFDGRQSSYLIYWEGPVTVSGSQGGRGFVEMSGYQPEGTAAQTAPTALNTATGPANSPRSNQGSATQATQIANLAGQHVVVTTDRSNLRAGPTTATPVIDTLAIGSPLRVHAQSGDWLQVSYGAGNETLAWIHISLVGRTQAVQ